MIGRQVSHFYIIRALGSGGMGVVYEAQDTRLPRSVAIKFLTAALSRNVEAVRRFKREARLAASLNHPNICTILDVDEGEGQCFIAMELLHGSTLKARLADADGPLPLKELLDVGAQVADALGAAHDQGIIHRDITPGNVFLTAGGLVKLLDFGLAKHFAADDGGDTEDLTVTGAVAGTIHYMAPERLVPDGPVDYRCDLFSLGVVLFQMATGARPFDIGPRSALITAIREHAHVPLHELMPGLPAELGRIVDRLLAKHPDARYQTALEVRTDLDRLRLAAGPMAADEPPRTGTSIAVLPFEVIGAPDEILDAVRDGLAEDIGGALSAVRGLRVAPRTSIRAALGQSIREMGRSLGVDLVLEGTVQRAADRLRVTANLVDTAGERSVGPRVRLDRRVDDLLTTQSDLAGEVCESLVPSLSRRTAAGYTQDADAYHAFKRAQHLWRTCFAGGWRQTLQHLEYAIERDPRFAQAHVALANAYNFLGFYCLLKPSLAFGVARREAALALAVDDSLASAWVELALAKLGGDWDWEGSELAFRQALALEPADPLAHVHYSWLLALLGRPDAALAEAQKGHGLAPSSRLVGCARAQTLYLTAHYEEAIEICNDSLHVDPGYAFALHLRGLSHLAQSEQGPAVADLEQATALCNRAPFYLGLLGRCYGQFGLRERALSVLAELQGQARDTYVPPQCYVYIYAGLGEPGRALEYQDQAYQDGASPFNYLTPNIRDMYALDPYHKQRLEQMRLVL